MSQSSEAISSEVQATPAQVLRRVWTIAWPVVVASLIDATEGIVDIYMVGKLGPAAISAIGMSRQIVFIFMVMAMSITSGTRTLVAQFFGAERHEDVSKTAQQALLMGVCLALVLGTVSFVLARPALILLGAPDDVLIHAVLFLRWYFAGMVFMILHYVMSAIFAGVGDTRTPLKISIVVIIIKCITSYGFIFGVWGFPEMGVAGAAVGTVISRALGCLIGFSILTRGHRLIRLAWNWQMRPDWSIMTRMLQIGLPSGASGFFRNGARVLLYRVVSGTRQPTLALASLTMGFQIRMYAILPAIAFSIAGTALVGQRLGAKEIEAAEQYGTQTIRLCMFLVCSGSLVIWLFTETIVSFFTQAEDVIGMSSTMLRFFAFAQIFSALSIVVGGVLAAGGETKPPLYYTIIGQWGIMLLFAYILAYPVGLDVTGIWIAWVAGGTTQGVLTLRRYFKGTWKRTVV
jgi:putative MATE family efflux protein